MPLLDDKRWGEKALHGNPQRRLLHAILRELNLLHFADLLFDDGIDSPVDVVGVGWDGLASLGLAESDARRVVPRGRHVPPGFNFRP